MLIFICLCGVFYMDEIRMIYFFSNDFIVSYFTFVLMRSKGMYFLFFRG